MKKQSPIFDLEFIKQEFATTEPDDDGRKWVFLGTVMSLTPSGKFYTPWACSNVYPCPMCGGSGSIPNKHAKRRSHDRAHRQIIRVALGNARGSGWLKLLSSRQVPVQKLIARRNYYQACNECPACEGIGSREAMLDQRWYDQAEEELDNIGASLTSGEGDSCDLFAIMCESSDEDGGGAKCQLEMQ